MPDKPYNPHDPPLRPGYLEVEDPLFRVTVVKCLQELFDEFHYFVPNLCGDSSKYRAQEQLIRTLAAQLLGEDFKFEEIYG